MCVPTLPVTDKSSYRLLCCLASLYSKIYHCRSVEMLQRSMLDSCVFWQRGSWQYRTSTLGKNLWRPLQTCERHSQPLLVSFRPEKQKKLVHRRWRETNATSGRQHVSRPQRLVGGKDLEPRTCDPSRCSSLLGALCFSPHPIVPPTGGMFLLDDKRYVFAVSGLFWQDGLSRKELVENVEFWENTKSLSSLQMLK